MKARHFVIAILLLLCVACHTPTREARRMVKRAEQLADTLPDSTVRLIDSVLHMPVYFSERERMDMALLQAEALFGDRGTDLSPIMDDDFFDDHADLSTSPELERAAAYFAQKKQYAKAAHAALYSGFVQQHYDEKEVAMRSFKEAEQYGKLVDDSLTVALAQYRIGKMLYDDYRSEEALALLKESGIHYGLSYGERAYVRNMEAIAYITLNQFDQAEKSLEKSLNYAEQAQTAKVKLKVLNNYAVLRRLEGKYDEAIAYLKQIKEFPSLSGSEKALLYLNLGKVFLAQNKSDSAAYYYHQLEEILPTDQVKDETKASSYGTLSRLAEIQGDTALAFQYLKRLEEPMSVIQATIEKQTVFRIQQQYDYESLQNAMNKKIIQRHITILIISILLFITIIIILVLQNRHKQLLKSEEEMKQQLDNLKQDLLQTVKTSVLDHEISSRLRLILKVHDKTPQGNDPKKEWQSLVWQIMNGEQEAFEAARSVLETAYPKLYSTIKENYPDLTETEAKICLLSCSDLSNTEIAELLGLSTNTVNQNRSNLRKKLNLKTDRMKEQLRSALSN